MIKDGYNYNEILEMECKWQNQTTMTIREYLRNLLDTMWREKEQFSGKRPWGNSDWDSDLIIPLINNKLLSGKIDDDGYIEDYDEEQFNKIIIGCIFWVFRKHWDRERTN